jgi:hypothetical protein
VAKAPREIDAGGAADGPQGDEPGPRKAVREPDDSPRPVAKPAWGKVELVRFLRDASAKPSASPILRGLLALMTEGPEVMDDIDRHSVPGLHDYLKTLAD